MFRPHFGTGRKMYDFSKDISKFHQKHVRLTNEQRADMRGRRTRNHDRVIAGLAELGKPALVDTINQGGYAQKTMTQPPEADEESRYDIDMGVVFDESDALTPKTTKGWVRDAIALKAPNMKFPPEAKPKCVRVVYANGYQCDFPVFRRRWTGESYTYDLAAGDAWVQSDPRAMNAWLEDAVISLSPEGEGSRQLRRIIRLGKFFAKVHAARLNRKFPGGLVATAIFVEAYQSVEGRDDQSFYETLQIIAGRSEYSPVYANGVQISDAKDVDRIKRLIDEAAVAVEKLSTLADDVSESDARKAWKKVFRHSFFDEVVVENALAMALETKSAFGASVLAAPMLASSSVAALSQAEKAERMHSAVSARQSEGSGGKPWSK
jgi:5-carboxymethyl-2-hydroxymuconate isomerase